MENNIDYSEKWVMTRLLKQYKENKDLEIKIKMVDLLRLILTFIKLNKTNYEGVEDDGNN